MSQSNTEDVLAGHYLEEMTPIWRHQYPVYIKLMWILLLGIFLYSLYPLPAYIKASHEFRIGKELLNDKKYSEAVQPLAKVLAIKPDARKAKILLAEAYFASSEKEEQIRWMMMIQDLSLDENEWNEITKTMPKEFQELFTSSVITK